MSRDALDAYLAEQTRMLAEIEKTKSESANAATVITALDEALKAARLAGQALCIVGYTGTAAERAELLAALYVHTRNKLRLTTRVQLPTVDDIDTFFDKTVPALTKQPDIFATLENATMPLESADVQLLCDSNACKPENVRAAQHNKAVVVTFVADEDPLTLAVFGKLTRRFARISQT